MDIEPLHDAARRDAPGEQRSARTPAKIAREAEAARADFHRAAAAAVDETITKGPRPNRSAALQAFFLANAGRGLMPSMETSGTLSPSLKTEEP